MGGNIRAPGPRGESTREATSARGPVDPLTARCDLSARDPPTFVAFPHA